MLKTCIHIFLSVLRLKDTCLFIKGFLLGTNPLQSCLGKADLATFVRKRTGSSFKRLKLSFRIKEFILPGKKHYIKQISTFVHHATCPLCLERYADASLVFILSCRLNAHILGQVCEHPCILLHAKSETPDMPS